MKKNDIRTIHYLGSKLRLLDVIKATIDNIDVNNGKICDLFCGSAVVSEYMLQSRNVVAVDIQQYSKVLCEAGLTYIIPELTVEEVVNAIKKSPERRNNIEQFQELLVYEEKCMEKAHGGSLEELYEIIEKGSLFSFINKLEYAASEPSNNLMRVINETTKNIALRDEEQSLDTIVTRYYGGLYFSFKQAIDIDAIASFAFSQDGIQRSKILAALIGATADIVNTVGKQFAQPLKVRNRDGSLKTNLAKKIITDREMNVFEKFGSWLQYYFDRPETNNEFSIICCDYKEALKSFDPGEISVIYADPPYTRYHYSRYYHVLETICRHDNPKISTTFPNGKGGLSRAIYRDDRFQSPFCIKSQAKGAFEELFELSKGTGAALILSYSPYDKTSGATPRLLSIEQLVQMAKKQYSEISVVSPGNFMHSRLNSIEKNHEINYEAERLIVCK